MTFTFHKALLLAALTICSCVGTAQQKGMIFFEGSWEQLMAKAKQTSKPVFVDVYTTWCACKLMTKNIFPQEPVGEAYNSSFLNYKLDAETPEGKVLAGKYNVSSYPTFLYLKNDGELVHKAIGYYPDEKVFIGEAAKALKAVADPYTVHKMNDAFKDGNRDTSFLKMYVSKLTILEMDNAAPLDAYLSILPSSAKKLPRTLEFLMDNVSSVPSESFAHIINNSGILFDGDSSRTMQAANWFYKLGTLLQQEVLKCLENDSLEQAKKWINTALQLSDLPAFFKDFFEGQQLEYYDKANMIPALVTATNQFLKEFLPMSVQQIKEENQRQYNAFMQPYITGQYDSTKQEDFEKLREYMEKSYVQGVAERLYVCANHFYNKVKDKNELKRALKWSAMAVELMPDNEQYKKLQEKITGRL